MKSISVLSILEALSGDYILLRKWMDFPSFFPGSDVDLLVIDRFDSSLLLQNYFMEFIKDESYYLKVTEGKGHIHLDIMEKDRIFLRIDLIDGFDYFTRFSVQDALKIRIFLSRKTIDVDNQKVVVPSTEFDLLLRYLEYLEWFDRRPDKIKHIDYILSTATEDQIQELINDTHRYLRYNHKKWPYPINQNIFFIDSRKKAIKEILNLCKYVVQKTIKPSM